MTEGRAFETLLRSDPELLRSLVDQAADALCLHQIDGRILDVNRRMCPTLGYSREELLTLSVLDIDVNASVDETALAARRLVPDQGIQSLRARGVCGPRVRRPRSPVHDHVPPRASANDISHADEPLTDDLWVPRLYAPLQRWRSAESVFARKRSRPNADRSNRIACGRRQRSPPWRRRRRQNA